MDPQGADLSMRFVGLTAAEQSQDYRQRQIDVEMSRPSFLSANTKSEYVADVKTLV
jgi:hypothetical protein